MTDIISPNARSKNTLVILSKDSKCENITEKETF